MTERGIDDLRIVFRFQLSFIDANQFLSFPRFFAKAIVGDPVKPRGKTRLTAEAAQVLVSPEKGLLRKIVSEGDIGPDELAEQTSDARLMIPHQLGKGMVVVIDKNACDEVCIG